MFDGLYITEPGGPMIKATMSYFIEIFLKLLIIDAKSGSPSFLLMDSIVNDHPGFHLQLATQHSF